MQSPTFLKRKTLSLSVSLALTCAPFAAVHAADTTSKNKDDDKNLVKLETVTVTADPGKGFNPKYVQIGAFRDQTLLDVPMTVQVVPRAVLDAQAATGLYDALKNTAGVSRSQVSGTVADNLSIRGIAVENRTNYRLNGSLPINNLIDMPLEDKERVEALKGSSALYYGFTSPAGIVNLVTKRAGATPNLSFALNGNEYGQVVGHLDAGSKFGDMDQYGVRVNLVDGNVRNAIDDVTGHRSLAAIAADWQPTESLSFRFDFEDIRKKMVEQAAIYLLPAGADGKIALPRLPDPTNLLSGKWAKNDAKAQNVLLRMDYYINDNWAAVLEAGRAETDRGRNFTRVQNYNTLTGDGSLRISAGLADAEYINKNYRGEITGRMAGWYLDHELTFGVMKNVRTQNGPTTQTFTVYQNLYDPVEIAEPTATASVVYRPTEVNDKGIYAFDRIRIGDEWQALLGVRRTDYTDNVVSGSTETFYDVKKTSPSYGLIYKPRPDTSIYATYIEGLEETGVAPTGTTNEAQPLQPAVSKQRELGVRTEAIQGVTLSVGYFDIKRQSAYIDATNTYTLAGLTRYRGVEFSANGDVTENWSVYGSGLLLDPKVIRSDDPTLEGNVPENTPKRTFSLFTEYRMPFLPGVSVNAGAFYTSERAVNAANQAYIPGYTIYTAGLRYIMPVQDHKLTLQANINNLTDKRYWNATGSYLGEGLPRTVSFGVKFEM